MKILALNKRARFDYDTLETFQAGLVLTGQEVKSTKAGHMNLQGSYVVIRNEEADSTGSPQAYLLNASIPAYQPKNAPQNYDPLRTRKILIKKKEIRYLIGKTHIKGLTLVPLQVYNSKTGLVKLEFALAKGRRARDKREVIKKREDARNIERSLKGAVE